MEGTRICPRCRKINPVDAALCSDCGGAMKAQRVGEFRERVDYAPVEGMACPVCAEPMEEGEVFIERNRRYLNDLMEKPFRLVMRFRDAPHSHRVLRPREKRVAACCRSCGGLWMAPPPGPPGTLA